MTQKRDILTRDALRYLIASFLLLAAILKMISLWDITGSISNNVEITAILSYAAVPIELCLAGWIALSSWTWKSWSATVSLFTVFASINLYNIATGTSTCGCLGFLAISPINMLIVDLLVLLALVVHMPLRASGVCGRASFACESVVTVLVFVATGSLVSVGAYAQYESYLRRDSSIGITQLGISPAASLFPNASLIRSSLGLPPLSDLNLDGASSAADVLRRIVGEEVFREKVSRIPRHALFSQLRHGSLGNPILVETATGNVFILLRMVEDSEHTYLQVIQGLGSPFLVLPKRLSLNDSENIWQLTTDPSDHNLVIPLDGGRLAVNTLHHNFGVTQAGEEREAVVRFSNIGKTPIVLHDEPSVSCSCVSVGQKEFGEVAPGEQASVRVRVKAPNGNMRQFVDFEVSSQSSRKTKVLRFELLGSQPTFLVSSPERLDFGLLRETDPVTRIVRIDEATAQPIEIVDVKANDIPIKWSVRTELQPGSKFRRHFVTVGIDLKSLQPGNRSDILRIHTTSMQTPIISLPTTFRIGTRSNLTSDVATFGALQVGECSEKAIVLEFPVDAQCEVSPNSIQGNTTNVRIRIEGGIITATVNPHAVGSFHHSFEVIVQGDGWQESHELEVVGTVMEAE